jgi:hypothetical protein
VYDTTITGDGTLPTDRLDAITVPALVIDSAGSPPWLRNTARAVADALPHGRQRTLQGQFHEVAPEILAPVLTAFITN